MNAHHFVDDVKVQRFYLTLLGEARLWFQSKLCNTHEQLFHAWRSFSFDENVETIDSFVTRIRQVATLLSYGEPQVLEVFKNMLPNKIILDTVSNRRLETSSRNSKKNTDQRKVR